MSKSQLKKKKHFNFNVCDYDIDIWGTFSFDFESVVSSYFKKEKKKKEQIIIKLC